MTEGRREARAEEIQRLQREIAERQMRLRYLVLGDPFKGVTGIAVSQGFVGWTAPTTTSITPQPEPTNG